MAEPGFFRRKFLCDFALCQTFVARADDTHLWGECIRCGKRSGIVSREAVRRYAEAEEGGHSVEKMKPERPKKLDVSQMTPEQAFEVGRAYERAWRAYLAKSAAELRWDVHDQVRETLRIRGAPDVILPIPKHPKGC